MIEGPFRRRAAPVVRRLAAVFWALLIMIFLIAALTGCDGQDFGLAAVGAVALAAVLAVAVGDAGGGRGRRR